MWSGDNSYIAYSHIAQSISSGTYTIIVSDENACTLEEYVTLDSPVEITTTITTTDATCYEECTGTASIDITNGTSPYSYEWSNGETSQDIATLCAENYTIAITDFNGCTATDSFTISQPIEMLLSTTTTDANCGLADGTATVSITNGESPYTYLWDNSQTTETATNLLAATYYVSVYDNLGCLAVAVVTVSDNSDLAVIITSTDISCFGADDGHSTVTATGGTTPYSFLWSNGATDISATDLSAGIVSVTVTDQNNCTTVTLDTINEELPLLITPIITDVLCYGESTGAVNFNISGGTPPYYYNWSTGQSTATVTNLAANNYIVTVTDENGCEFIESFTINDNSSLLSTINTVNVSCNGFNDGSASVVASNGTSPYTYLWSNDSTNISIDSLVSGNISVTVTDDNGCISIANETINEPSPLSVSITTTEISCFNGSDGSAIANVSGGTPLYTYMWSGDNSYIAYSHIAQSISSGTYTIIVSDENACTLEEYVTLDSPVEITTTITTTDATCYEECTGTASIDITNGTSPYSYEWSNGETSQDIATLCAENYTIAITDFNGCTATDSFTISQPIEMLLSTTTTDANCGLADGTATVSITNGESPYTYLWDNSQTTETATNLLAATYYVSVYDNLGCLAVAVVTVSDNSDLAVIITSTDISCFGADDGHSTVTATGGTTPYSFLWSNGATDISATDLSAGIVSVTVTDQNNCTTVTLDTINEELPLLITPIITDVLCYGESTGAVNFNISGGIPQYSVSLTCVCDPVSLTAGNYTAVVSDDVGCIDSVDFEISQPQQILTTPIVSAPNCNGGYEVYLFQLLEITHPIQKTGIQKILIVLLQDHIQ